MEIYLIGIDVGIGLVWVGVFDCSGKLCGSVKYDIDFFCDECCVCVE